MADISALNLRFGIPGHVTFRDAPGGLAVVEVANNVANATIALQGAHVTNWTPNAAEPVIWLSPAAKFATGKSIRGGVPICWPWFGPHATESAFPGHGFARTVPWEVTEATMLPGGATRLTFRLIENEVTRAQWPHAVQVENHVTVGETLEFDLATRNLGNKEITIGDALHTYFKVGDVRRISIHGLEDCSYLDKVDGGSSKRQSGLVTIMAETDRIYIESTNDCLIDDPVLRRRIRITKRGSRTTVVWNPWIEKAAKMGDFGDNGYLGMVCVESANAANDVVKIAPGGTHHLWVRYQVEPSA